MLVTREATRDDESRTVGTSVSHAVVLHTASGVVPVSVLHGANASEYEALAARIRAVIGMPAALHPDAEIPARVAAGRGVDAVARLRAETGMSLAAARAGVDGAPRSRNRPQPPGRRARGG